MAAPELIYKKLAATSWPRECQVIKKMTARLAAQVPSYKKMAARLEQSPGFEHSRWVLVRYFDPYSPDRSDSSTAAESRASQSAVWPER